MKNRIALALLAAFGATASLCAAEDFAIEWGEPFSLGAGGYARIHRLSDGRYMLAYGRGADMAARYSRKGAPEKWSKPVFITGDWNNVPKSNTLAALREFMTVISKEDCCTFHGRTDYPAEKEYCIDYIAVDSAHAPACKVREAYVTKNIVASDHNPIVAVVELERWCAAREGKAISLAKLKWRQRYAQ